MDAASPSLPLALLLLASSAALVSCASAPPPAPADQPDIAIVNATVVINACPDAKTMNAKAARAAIEKLVQPCDKVPGGAAHFSATLQPGGRIKLASPGGDQAEGVVPTCVLSNQLSHRVLLKSDCKFDVTLEERKISGMTAPAGSEATPPQN